MAARVRTTRAARRDVAAARDYYELQAAGLGQAFVDRFRECLQVIAASPAATQCVYGDYRRCLMKQFRYAVYYSFDGAEAIVHCVIHTSRHPSGWQRRLP